MLPQKEAARAAAHAGFRHRSLVATTVAAVLTAIATIFGAIPHVFPPIATVFAQVDPIFRAVTAILESVAEATIVAGIAAVFTAVAHVFAAIETVFTPIAHVFGAVASVLTSIADVLEPITRHALAQRSALGREGRSRDGNEQGSSGNDDRRAHGLLRFCIVAGRFFLRTCPVGRRASSRVKGRRGGPVTLTPSCLLPLMLTRAPIRCTAALALSISLGTPTVAHAQDGKAEVLAVVKRLFDGMRAGDSAMVRSVFHPQVRTISASMRNGAPALNIETSADAFVKAVGTPHSQPWDEKTYDEKVEIDGPIASVWAEYTFHLGTTFSHCGIDHFLLAKDASGAWKIIELADTRQREGCKRR